MQEWAEQGFQTDATMQDMRALIDKAATPDDPPHKVLTFCMQNARMLTFW